ncbi:unnamed protein product [Mytilus coruscus]|uniref:Integrase catalytic domain-containing protein n=1 Tax=Mytilus coruscus TaxID=42192 RepID=A0A6J8DES4_MYTCO|nr:unnamed protein product [Mytilus coruscus]
MTKTNDDIKDQDTEDETHWIEQKTTDEIIQAQKSDEILGKLYQMKTESKDKPKLGDIAIQNPIIKRKQPPSRAKSKMKQYHVGAPMERVALDIIGPFPLSKKGNKYALIVSDYFTRWAEGYPMPDMETKTIIDNFANNFVCIFGVPRQIHTDQGRQFESALFKELCTRLCIDKTRTTPYRPQSDGLVERLNRSLEEILSKYICSNQKDWDEQLPWAFMAYRSSVHESTKFSPCKLMLGREIELPIDLIYGPHPQNEEFSDETHAVNEHMIQITRNIHGKYMRKQGKIW